MSNDHEKSERLVHLESLIAHLQHSYDQLNDELVEQNRKIEQLQSAQDKLEHQIESLTEEGETRNPEQERPPHY